MKTSKNFLISNEERTLFKEAVANVTPLPATNKAATYQHKPRPTVNHQAYQEHALDPLLDKQPVYEQISVGTEETLLFAKSGLQTRLIQRLKRGEFAIEGVLDLHGFKLAEAAQVLDHFLAQALESHWRCVLIIHGKGIRSGSEIPLLKNSVNQWLRAYPLVLAFCSAKAQDGGTGAVYALLKRCT